MRVSFGCDHAFAQQHLGAAHRAFFDEVVVLDNQHLANVVGFVQEDDVFAANLVVRDVAVFAGEELEKSDRVSGVEFGEDVERQIKLEAWRKMIETRHGLGASDSAGLSSLSTTIRGDDSILQRIGWHRRKAGMSMFV